MKYVFSLLVCFFCLGTAIGQQSISGRIIDTENVPLEYATVLLLKTADSTLTQGAITTEKGDYTFENVVNGTYYISASMVGYKTEHAKSFTVQGAPMEMIPIILPKGIDLDEVTVVGRKPLFEKEVDRTIVNVQSNVINKTSSVLDVLGRSPGVSVNKQNGGIRMGGKSGIQIMINGKINRMPLDAVVQMLDGMSANQVEKIELITTPPAKYEAEGNAGLINIVMTESPDMGTNGNAGATVGFNKGIILGANAGLTHRSKKLSIFANYTGSYDDNINDWNTYHRQTVDGYLQTTNSESLREPVIINHSFHGGLEYQLTGTTTLSTLISGAIRDWDMDANTHVESTKSQDSSIVTDMSLHEDNVLESFSGSLGIKEQLNDKSILGLIYDYLYFHRDNPSQYNNQVFVNGNSEEIDSKIDVSAVTPMNFHVLSLDYSSELNPKMTMETGIKATFAGFTNDVEVRESESGGEMTLNPEFTNAAILDENYQAAYISFNWNPNTTWSLSSGLRYEHTDTEIHTPEGESLVSRNYGNWFPTVFAKYQLSEANSLTFSYSRRITRPTFDDLAPFVFFIGPTSFSEGNQALRPGISDNIDLGFQHKNIWLTLKYSNTEDHIAILQLQDNATNESQVYQSENFEYMRSLGATISLPINIDNWWEIQNNVEYYHYRYLSQHLKNNSPRHVNSVILSSNHTFSLPEDYTISLSANYHQGEFWGTLHFEPYGQVDMGVSKTFSNGSTLTLTGSDLFATYKFKVNTQTTYSENLMLYDWHARAIKLTFTLPFGNRKLKDVEIKSGAEEEKGRVN
ncbi:TonB-dependent receptor [Galbibacter sp. EGI 63066]|uniref:TonB-dependent receptor domain-containing protein n=1 Tax=Galbibacter sp. EGI 63066 TaxID=2993559 RepID=UPI00224930D6|nr:TonB-dependent receptor [Galbibacter sp. EGI 63066]MCX2680185.1 TonB-dependent receptor [Galbibacter sp. EGI 63066]